MNEETVFDTDQTGPDATSVSDEETPNAEEKEKWVSLKNDLQEFLCRRENEDQPSFEDEVILDWIEKNGERFDLFFETIKKEDAHKLVTWHTAARDNNVRNDIELIQRWATWKNTAAPI